MKKSLLSTLSLTLILSSCALPSDPFTKVREQDEQFRKTLPVSNADYGSFPKDFQAQIKSYMNTVLKDPDSAKYSNLTKPFKSYTIYKQNIYQAATHDNVYYGYSVCFSLNAKNSYGAYTGNSQYVAFFHNKKIVEVKEADKSLTQITGIVSAYIGSTDIHCPKN